MTCPSAEIWLRRREGRMLVDEEGAAHEGITALVIGMNSAENARSSP
jgi:hypothetical protein